jgi:aryl-alcohol dehydrogenase-like predicted oxidoreductase
MKNTLSRITLGTAQLGMKYGIANRDGQPSYGTALEILGRSEKSGVFTWDTSPLYGNSESIIGDYVRRYRPQQIEISTKLPSLQSLGTLTPRQVRHLVESRLRTSLNNLARECVEYYLIHDENDFLTFGDALIDTLSELQAAGLIKRMGISVYSPDIALKALEIEKFDAIQLPFNLLDRRFEEAGVLELANRRGATVFARSVFLQGLFFLTLAILEARLPAATEFVRKVRAVAEQSGRSVVELAFAFVNDHPAVSSLVIGTETASQLQANVELLKQKPLTNKERGAIYRCFQNVPASIVNPTQWQ